MIAVIFVLGEASLVVICVIIWDWACRKDRAQEEEEQRKEAQQRGTGGLNFPDKGLLKNLQDIS